jgi:hypothetical protein
MNLLASVYGSKIKKKFYKMKKITQNIGENRVGQVNFTLLSPFLFF